MPEQAVIAFHCIGFGFGLRMQPWRDELFIGLPIVTHDIRYAVVFDGVPAFSSGFRVAGTHFAAGESPPMSINSNPCPAIVFFEPT